MEFWGTLYFQTSHLPIWVSKCSIFAMFLCAMPFWGTDFRGAGWVSWDEVWGLANFGDLRPEFWDPPHQVSKPNCHKTVASQVKRPWIRVTIEPFHPCNSGRVGSKMAPHMWNVVFIYIATICYSTEIFGIQTQRTQETTNFGYTVTLIMHIHAFTGIVQFLGTS